MTKKNIALLSIVALVLFSFAIGCAPKQPAVSADNADTSTVVLPDTTFTPDTMVDRP